MAELHSETQYSGSASGFEAGGFAYEPDFFPEPDFIDIEAGPARHETADTAPDRDRNAEDPEPDERDAALTKAEAKYQTDEWKETQSFAPETDTWIDPETKEWFRKEADGTEINLTQLKKEAGDEAAYQKHVKETEDLLQNKFIEQQDRIATISADIEKAAQNYSVRQETVFGTIKILTEDNRVVFKTFQKVEKATEDEERHTSSPELPRATINDTEAEHKPGFYEDEAEPVAAQETRPKPALEQQQATVFNLDTIFDKLTESVFEPPADIAIQEPLAVKNAEARSENIFTAASEVINEKRDAAAPATRHITAEPPVRNESSGEIRKETAPEIAATPAHEMAEVFGIGLLEADTHDGEASADHTQETAPALAESPDMTAAEPVMTVRAQPATMPEKAAISHDPVPANEVRPAEPIAESSKPAESIVIATKETAEHPVMLAKEENVPVRTESAAPAEQRHERAEAMATQAEEIREAVKVEKAPIPAAKPIILKPNQPVKISRPKSQITTQQASPTAPVAANNQFPEKAVSPAINRTETEVRQTEITTVAAPATIPARPIEAKIVQPEPIKAETRPEAPVSEQRPNISEPAIFIEQSGGIAAHDKVQHREMTEPAAEPATVVPETAPAETNFETVEAGNTRVDVVEGLETAAPVMEFQDDEISIAAETQTREPIAEPHTPVNAPERFESGPVAETAADIAPEQAAPLIAVEESLKTAELSATDEQPAEPALQELEAAPKTETAPVAALAQETTAAGAHEPTLQTAGRQVERSIKLETDDEIREIEPAQRQTEAPAQGPKVTVLNPEAVTAHRTPRPSPAATGDSAEEDHKRQPDYQAAAMAA